MEKLSYVDQVFNSPVLQFITESNRTIDVAEADVLVWIEENSLNVSTEGTGLTCDPYGTEHEVLTDANLYLDNNFDAVCQQYFNSILVPNLLKHVA